MSIKIRVSWSQFQKNIWWTFDSFIFAAMKQWQTRWLCHVNLNFNCIWTLYGTSGNQWQFKSELGFRFSCLLQKKKLMSICIPYERRTAKYQQSWKSKVAKLSFRIRICYVISLFRRSLELQILNQMPAFFFATMNVFIKSFILSGLSLETGQLWSVFAFFTLF